MESVISYGMSRNYLPDWGYREALREIYQNFKDWGEYEQEYDEIAEKGIYRVSLVNDYCPDEHSFLKLGESGKRGDDSKIGKHGEGLKMASMVLLRNGSQVKISYGDVFIESCWIDRPYIGECFGYRVKEIGEGYPGFRIVFDVPCNEFSSYLQSQIKEEDVIHSTVYGELLNKPQGEVYVGGQFVGVVDGLKYAYNFQPQFVKLDRDRAVPRDFDVDWTASKILESWNDLKTEDLSSRDARYMDRVPEKIVKKFKPSIVGGGVVFRSGSVQASDRVSKRLLGMPINQKRVAKLRSDKSRKRAPHALLAEFFEKHGESFSDDGKIDMMVLMKKARGWRNK